MPSPTANSAQAPSDHEVVEGQVAGVVFENQETGFAVVRLLSTEGAISVAGALSPVHEGEQLRLHGWWETHPRFGKQFRAAWSEHAAPSTLEGVERYLGSGAFPGIGPDVARRLVAHFGADTLQALGEGEGRLREVDGIGEKRAATLAETFRDGSARHRVFAELRGLGLNGSQGRVTYELLGPGAIERLKQDPYALIGRVRGYGFESAEKVARAVGLSLTGPERARGVALHLMREAVREGHVCLPESLVIERLLSLGVEDAVVVDALRALDAASRLRRADLSTVDPNIEPALYLPEMLESEVGVARCLGGMLRRPPSALATPAQVESALARTQYRPDPSQRAALEMALLQPVSVLTGGPGTGKTTTLRLLLEIFEAAGVGIVKLASPTGRAAKRLQEATGREASTLHRLLGWDPVANGFRHDEDEPLELDFLVVDEVSMLDLPLAHAVLRALPTGARLLLVGDADQLPPVGPGSVLADLITSGVVPVTRLARIHRQGEDSGIVEAAHLILAGQSPAAAASDPASPAGGDFFLALREDPEEAAALVEQLLRERIPRRYDIDPVREVLVLAPMYRGPLGVNELNRRIGLALNPDGEAAPEWTGGLRVGDRVMAVRNDYEREIFNGDAGRVVRASDSVLTIEVDGRLLEYSAADLADLVPAWCVTVHRAQGSEARAVVIVLGGTHWMMLRRKLLYTAVTRGRELVVLVASRAALARAVRNDEEGRRHGLLRVRLAAG
ncbi:MAG: ATP-dependent RecD-like DNA helicase [Planctomycetota bacterium]|nr:ATP-dependent RecD-like DNA helicase [Planctomycetota bacterium]